MKYKLLKKISNLEPGDIMDSTKELSNCHTVILTQLLLDLGYIKEDDGKWEPKEEEDYWYIDNDGETDHTSWHDDSFDRGVKHFSGIYQTEQEAISARDRIKEFVKNGFKII